MRTFKKSFVPDSIEYKGQTLKLNAEKTVQCTLNGKSKILEANWLSTQYGKTVCLVEVMNPKLKGKTDLHSKPYTPNIFIFSN